MKYKKLSSFKNPVQSVAWYFNYGLTGQKWKLSFFLVTGLLLAGSEFFGIWMILPILNLTLERSLENQNSMSPIDIEATKLSWQNPEVLPNLTITEIWVSTPLSTLLSLIVFIYVARFFLSITNAWLTAKCQWGLMSFWSSIILKNYMSSHLQEFAKKEKGKLRTYITSETQLAAAGIKSLMSFLTQLMLILSIVLLIIHINKSLAIYLLLLLMVLATSLWGVAHKMTLKISREILSSKLKTESYISEALAAMRQIRAAKIENRVQNEFDVLVENLTQKLSTRNIINSIPKPASELILIVSIVVIIIYILNNDSILLEKHLPEITVFVIAANRLVTLTTKITTQYMNFIASIPSLKLLMELMQGKKANNGPSKPVEELKILDGNIQLKNVSFSYPPHNTKIFEELNMTLEKNKITLLSGKSGAGKSTLIDLLLGFSKPTSGSIFFGSKNMHAHNGKAIFSSKIGYVAQDMMLMNASILDNFRFMIPDVSEQEVADACKRAHIHERIEKMQNKYNTIVGDRGCILSGGERQRIAIAIAFLRNDYLLVFDEATSALDEANRAEILNTLADFKNKTILYVSHQENTAFRTMNHYMLKDGKAITAPEGVVT